VVRGKAWSSDGVISDLKSIGSRLESKAPLLLTKDQAVLWVSEAREELSNFFEIALPEKETVDLLMNKVRFLKLAQSEGWPVPHTWMAESKAELVSLSEIIYPCILKPQLKNDLFRTHSPKKAFRVRCRKELIQTYDLVSQWEKEVVIQEWIDGADNRIGFCLGYCDRTSEARALFAGRKLIQWPVGWGNTAISEPAPPEWCEPMIALTNRIWQKVGYKGLGSLEFKMRGDSSIPVIMEPTVGRTDFQSEVAVLNGVNIPAVAYCDLAGLPLPSTRKFRRRTKLIDGPSHLRAARVFIGQPDDLGFPAWLGARKGRKRYMIFRSGDYGPFLSSIRQQIRSMVGHSLEMILGARLKGRLLA
jgi:predicted ATP-grasp superfamily ATP-dependent carboligase